MRKNERGKRETSTALVAFLSGVASAALSLFATLATLKPNLPADELGQLLIGMVWILAGVTFLVLLWAIGLTLGQRIAEAASIERLRRNVRASVRVRKQMHRILVRPDGSASVEFSIQVEVAPETSFPWFTVPIGSSSSPTLGDWKSVEVKRIVVDGQEHSPSASVRRYSRHTIEYANPPLEMEEFNVTLPVSMGPNKRRSSVLIEAEYHSALSDILTGEYWYFEPVLVTDSASISIEGTAGLRVFPSPGANYYVQARTGRQEQVDTVESQEQSELCKTSNGVLWETGSAKIGYRYEISIKGQM